MNLKRCSGLATGVIVAVMVFVLASTASAEWKEKVLYSFQGVPDGAVPTGALVFDKAGNLYGATGDGGASTCDGPGQCGTVYQLAPPAKNGGAWTETVLHVFKGHAYNDGATPEGGLVIDQAGNLYGTTGYGGSGPCTLLGGAVGCGTVYELSPPAKQGDPWTETVLYSFQGSKDGFVGFGDLVFDTAGNVYGATLFGGGKGTTCNSLYGGQCGTVFKLSPPKQKGGKWTEKVLHRFAGGMDGANPNGGLVLDSKGSVYGTTYAGGGKDWGTVFQLKPSNQKGGAWSERMIHRFQGSQDGVNPAAGLTFGSDGDLYGTTLTGGRGGGGGTVFRLTPPTKNSGLWKKVILYGFRGTNDGVDLEAALVVDSKGNLYGTALDSGGTFGTVFRLTPPTQKGGTWTFNLLYGFQGVPDGGQPSARLIFDNNGNLYGTTQAGGNGQACQGGCGAVFRVFR
jgi:uncharacterized repeat protein (TIGR03803 family)